MNQHFAGYILPGLVRSLEAMPSGTTVGTGSTGFAGPDSGVRELLETLSCFHMQTEYGGSAARMSDAPIAAAANMLRRGLPTIASVRVEEAFAAAFGKTCRVDDGRGGFRFEAAFDDDESWQRLHRALHVVDPRLKAKQCRKEISVSWEKLSPEFEGGVYHSVLPAHFGEIVAQLVEPRRDLSDVLGLRNQLAGQPADFAIEFPGTIDGIRGVVLEIDGEEHGATGTAAQRDLDAKRDKALLELGWRTVRIPVGQLEKLPELTSGISQLFDSQYFRILRQNYDDPLLAQTDGRAALQLMLSPFGIARVQNAVLEAVLAGALPLDASEWTIVVLERDVPCASLAIDDLQHNLELLFRLENKRRELPSITLAVYSTEEFQGAELHGASPHTPGLAREIDKAPDCDLFIDCSVLQRDGMSGEEVPVRARSRIVIRSAFSMRETRTLRLGGRAVWLSPDESDATDSKNAAAGSENAAAGSLDDALQLLTANLLRKSTFLPGQLPLLKRLLSGRSSIGILPPAGGKSLLYQLAALLQPTVTIVVEPVDSAIEDQIEGLHRNFIDAIVRIDSSMNNVERTAESERLASGSALFCFVTPEQLRTRKFHAALSTLKSAKISCECLVLDEAHSMSEWSHDFRMYYFGLPAWAREHLSVRKTEPLVAAFSGTASHDVVAEISWQFRSALRSLKDDAGLVTHESGTLPADMDIRIIPVAPASGGEAEARFDILHTALREMQQQSATAGDNAPGRGVVFCPHASGPLGVTDKYSGRIPPFGIGDRLESQKFNIGISVGNDSHNRRAGTLAARESAADRRSFREGRSDILVATRAYGIGTDIPGIRYSLHVTHPATPQQFLQESTRCGREGCGSVNALLYALPGDRRTSGPGPDAVSARSRTDVQTWSKESERRILAGLLEEISYPEDNNVSRVTDVLCETFGLSINARYWQRVLDERLYVETADGQVFGYVDLVTRKCATDESCRNPVFAARVLDTALAFMTDEAGGGPTISAWVSTTYPSDLDDGLEKQLDSYAPGAMFKLRLGFENDKEPILDTIHKLLWKEADIRVYRKLYSQAALTSWEDFRRSLEKLGKKEGLFENIDELLEKSAQQHFLGIRHLEQTERAIHRLMMLGIVVDFTVDFSARSFMLQVNRPRENEFQTSIDSYLEGLYPGEEVCRKKKKLDTQSVQSSVGKYTAFLLDTIYELLEQRIAADIDDMERACIVGVQGGGDAFSRHVNHVLISRYALPDALPFATGQGSIASIDTVWTYIDRITSDAGASTRQNLQHLEKSCRFLLMEHPDHPVYHLLTAFSMLAATPENDRRNRHAMQHMLYGFKAFVDGGSLDKTAYPAAVDRFKEAVQHWTADKSVSEVLKQLDPAATPDVEMPEAAAASETRQRQATAQRAAAAKQKSNVTGAKAEKAKAEKAKAEKAETEKAKAEKAKAEKAKAEKAKAEKAKAEKAKAEKAKAEKAKAEKAKAEKAKAEKAKAEKAKTEKAKAEKAKTVRRKEDETSSGDDLIDRILSGESSVADFVPASIPVARRTSKSDPRIPTTAPRGAGASDVPSAAGGRFDGAAALDGRADSTVRSKPRKSVEVLPPEYPLLVSHVKWLKTFNNSFLKNYEPGN